MEYFEPEKIERTQLLNSVSNSESYVEVIEAALSAIYYQETEFAGRILLIALKRTHGPDREYALNVIETFMVIHQTDLLGAEFLAEIGKTDLAAPHKKELEDSVREYMRMYAQK
ncbi:hypothetical protein [Ascidiaceihabitans sp.]|uniref:hypothetical protein n=1 Tax=Ascidiaceihabitans sp. TaxID=1872644 RepID=UPI003298F96A